MDSEKIVRAEKLYSEIKNFREFYEGLELYGNREGWVTAEALMAFLIENPYFQQIADKIEKLDT